MRARTDSMKMTGGAPSRPDEPYSRRGPWSASAAIDGFASN